MRNAAGSRILTRVEALSRLPLSTFLVVGSTALVAGLIGLPSAGATVGVAAVHVATLFLAVLSLLLAPDPQGNLLAARRYVAGALTAAGAGLVIGATLTVSAGTQPVPSVADAVSLLWFPLALVGIWRVPRLRTPRSGTRLFCDAALASSGLLFAGWLAFIEPFATQHGAGWDAVVVQTAYPVCDVVVCALLLACVPTVAAELRGFYDTVALGLLLVATSDAGATMSLVAGRSRGIGWPDVPMQLGLGVLALSPWRQGRSRRVRPLLDQSLPQLAVGLAAAAAVWRVFVRGVALDREDCLFVAVMVLAGICRQVLHIAELTRLAEQDPLTGLANRRALVGALETALASHQADQVRVLLLDVDGLEEINDHRGPGAGDCVLRAVGDLVSEASGPRLVARTGSDEFVVVLVGSGAAEAASLADELGRWHQLLVAGDRLDVGCSVGLAEALPGDEPRDLLTRAWLALAAAKGRGRRWQVWTPELGEHASRRRQVVAALAAAVERDQLSLVYQPVTCLSDGRVAAVEALLRWRHPELGEVPPAEFVPLAEASGHIGAIGDWVLRSALAQVAAWDAEGRPLPRVFVNVSARQLGPELPGAVLGHLVDLGLSTSRLVIEVTESDVPDLVGNAALAALRAAGVQVALDDFGAGYTSLGQLVRLPADLVKLDREFVANLDEPGGEALLTGAVHLAHSLGLRVVAEGVETSEQLRAVRAAGVDLAQGFHLARPCSPEALRAEGDSTLAPAGST